MLHVLFVSWKGAVATIWTIDNFRLHKELHLKSWVRARILFLCSLLSGYFSMLQKNIGGGGRERHIDAKVCIFVLLSHMRGLGIIFGVSKDAGWQWIVHWRKTIRKSASLLFISGRGNDRPVNCRSHLKWQLQKQTALFIYCNGFARFFRGEGGTGVRWRREVHHTNRFQERKRRGGCGGEATTPHLRRGIFD